MGFDLLKLSQLGKKENTDEINIEMLHSLALMTMIGGCKNR